MLVCIDVFLWLLEKSCMFLFKPQNDLEVGTLYRSEKFVYIVRYGAVLILFTEVAAPLGGAETVVVVGEDLIAHQGQCLEPFLQSLVCAFFMVLGS